MKLAKYLLIASLIAGIPLSLYAGYQLIYIPTVSAYQVNVKTLQDTISKADSEITRQRMRITEVNNDHSVLLAEMDEAQKALEERDNSFLELTRKNSDLEVEIADLKVDMEKTQNDLQSLRQESSDLNELRATKAELEAEIAEYRKERQALIPKKVTENNIKCTGSMNPKITCLDSITVITNPRPEDIVIGSVITFRNYRSKSIELPALLCTPTIGGIHGGCRYAPQKTDIGCDGTPALILHRVVDIKYIKGNVQSPHPFEGAELSFRTKGDANSKDDGCWVPFSLVQDYVVEVIKGNYPVAEAKLQLIWSLEKQANKLENELLYEQKVLEEDRKSVNRTSSYEVWKFNEKVDAFNSKLAILHDLENDIKSMRTELDSILGR